MSLDTGPDPLLPATFSSTQTWALRELRVKYREHDGVPLLLDDRPTDELIRDVLNRCRCLLCKCDSRRTITHPTVCQQCSAGAHATQGGIL